LLVFMMALLLLYNRRVYQMVWISFLCVAMMALMAGNMRWVMKKTAREARNLWRKVQGMGGLERDDGEEGSDAAEQDAAIKATEVAAARAGLPPDYVAAVGGPGAQAAMLQLQRAGRLGTDVETGVEGDVVNHQRMDQQHQFRLGANAGRMSMKRPHQQLRFMSSMRMGGYGPRPIGESLERGTNTGHNLTSDTAAIATAIASTAVAAASSAAACARSSGPGWQNNHGVGGSASLGITNDDASRSQHQGGDTLVDLVEACREAGCAAVAAHAAANSNSGTHCRCSNCCSYRQSHSGRQSQHASISWWERVGAIGLSGGATACPGVHGTVSIVPWLGRPESRRSSGFCCGPYVVRQTGNRAVAGGIGGGLAGTGCRKRVVGRGLERCHGPGPLGEGTISNPLYGANEGGVVTVGRLNGTQLPFGHSLQLGMPPQWSSYGGAVSGVGPGPSGFPYGIPAEASTAGFHAAPFGGGGASSATSMIAAAAAAPYGGSAITVPAAPVPQQAAVLPPPPQADNGQWGSNPSSGSPEEADESASTGTGSGSGGSRSSAGQRTSKGHRHNRHNHPHPHGSRVGGEGGKNGHGEDEEDEDFHSETSIMEHELASGIEEKITRLFFFGRPFMLLWFFNIIFAQASLTMTMSMAFVIPYDKFDYIRDVAMPMYIWLPVVLTNLMLVFYGCWVFLPQYALLSVAGILEPHEVMVEIKRSKTADKTEEGISAIVLEKMSDYFIGRHDGETRLSTAFIVTLASQAGIILGRDYKPQKHINKASLKPMYREFMMVWHDIAWYGELTTPYMIKSDVPEFKVAFDELDEDGSGALSFGELANMIRSLGTYATAGDVEAMLWEIDIDNSHSIGYDEFVKFMVYAFFDTRQLGYIDTLALMEAMERLDMSINEMQASVLMSVGNCEPEEEVKVTLRQFFGMFEKVQFEEVEALKEAQDDEAAAAAVNGFLGRTKELLSSVASRMLTVSRLPEAAGGGSVGSCSVIQTEGLSMSEYRRGISGLSAAAGPAPGNVPGVSVSPEPGGGGGGPEGVRGKQMSRLAVVTKPRQP
ncbi:hypothetical protein Vretifemale_10772, partial [Volvox reticuliferus]